MSEGHPEVPKYEPIAPPGEMISKVPMALTSAGFQLESFDQAWKLAQSMIAGGMVPRGFARQPGAIIVLIQACSQLGIPLHAGLSNLTFTNGRFGVMGDLAHALVLRSGTLKRGTDVTVKYTGEPYSLEWTCVVTAWRAGHEHPIEREFSLRDAQAAGLCRVHEKEGRREIQTHSNSGGWGNHGAPWSTWTRRMLYYRALGFLLRDGWPDVLMGFHLAEELDEQPEERDVTPRESTIAEGPGARDPLLSLPAQTAEQPARVPEIAVDEGGGEREEIAVRKRPRGLRYAAPGAATEAIERAVDALDGERTAKPAQEGAARVEQEVPAGPAPSAPAPPEPEEGRFF